MDSDWESTFEIVSESDEIRKRVNVEKEEEATVNVKDINDEVTKESSDNIKTIRRKTKNERVLCEIAAITCFFGTLIIVWLTDIIGLSMTEDFLRDQPNIAKEMMIKTEADKVLQSRVAEFAVKLKMGGRNNRKPRESQEDTLFYLLSEKEPIELAFRRKWMADPSFFEGVDEFVYGMDWENTFEEDLFVRGVPNFDHQFELEEMTLKTTLLNQNYDQKFFNFGRKEMIDKTYSVEYFVSQRTLVKLEKKNGVEVSRTEYFLKLGDLYVYDKRGNLECTRVYYAPTIGKELMNKVEKQ
ncbi:hypothetical protein GCK72_005723 [Caenorhabditis remanei]|uniref:Uncharacterized protein n=1 Tax=Caenorhabditis remanei TaxID=31234 RepID=A0A6A5HDD4_CAERE|nr:hypothetical protein GCK72_005723 [Caenorhabditis remanei]KAF1765770.1 hypothetical protein GCK72_005723 [Caenorhabditis remanei]